MGTGHHGQRRLTQQVIEGQRIWTPECNCKRCKPPTTIAIRVPMYTYNGIGLFGDRIPTPARRAKEPRR